MLLTAEVVLTAVAGIASDDRRGAAVLSPPGFAALFYGDSRYEECRHRVGSPEAEERIRAEPDE